MTDSSPTILSTGAAVIVKIYFDKTGKLFKLVAFKMLPSERNCPFTPAELTEIAATAWPGQKPETIRITTDGHDTIFVLTTTP